jgi:hypothetical protein
MKRLSDLPTRDLELLSSYLDDRLSARQRDRLTKRLDREPELRWALEELRRTVSIVSSLPEVRPPRSFTLTREAAGERARPPAYPFLQLATALATLAFVAVVGLDALTGQGRPAALSAAAPEQAERVATQLVEAPVAAAPSETASALGMAQTEAPLEALSQAPQGTPVPGPAEGIGGGEAPLTGPAASEALPTMQAEDRARIPPSTPCIGCGGGGEGEGVPEEPPTANQVPPQATPTPAAVPTEAFAAKAGASPPGAAPQGAPTEIHPPSGQYRPGFSLIRLAEISLGLAALIMAGLTLWIRRSD